MAKIYLKKNVLESAFERIEIAFDNFDKVLVSCSGGKDSSLLIQLTNMVAEKKNKKFNVLFLDQEVISNYTVAHIEELKQLKNINRFFHICLPFEEDNAVSVFNPQWIMWDEEIKEKWVRKMPKDAINIYNNPFPFFVKGMADLVFYPKFSKWLAGDETLANIIGIRAQESLHRWKAVSKHSENRYNNYNFTMRENKHVVKFYPLYDFRTEDVWGAVFKFNFKYNYLYELMTQDGTNFNEQRICQPFGLDQRKSLDQFAKFEPELWDKMLNRVSGANYGALYARTEMLGHLKTAKPAHMTWQEYTCFLVESLSLQYPEIAEQYMERINDVLRYHKEVRNTLPTDDKETDDLDYISWKEIAKAVEKNDFWMKKIGYAENKKGYERLEKIITKYNNIL